MHSWLTFDNFVYLTEEFENTREQNENNNNYLYLFRLSLKIKYILEILKERSRNDMILKFKISVAHRGKQAVDGTLWPTRLETEIC